MTTPSALPIAIIGGGFSGTLLAINLARSGRSVVLIEREEAALGKGLAYGTRRTEHLLNVRASNMSAFPGDPGHFLRWMGFASGEQANRFVPRLAYGQYLRELLVQAMAETGQRIVVRHDEAIDLVPQDLSLRVVFDAGPSLDAAHVVLALGNLRPRMPAILAELPAGLAFADPWQGEAIQHLDVDDPVLLLGTGLTAIDVALSLVAGGHKGRILALSRRGLRPRPHALVGPQTVPVPPPRSRGSWLVRTVRQRIAETDWRVAVDELRPHTKALWQAHDLAGQKRFLRHLRPWWDVHRHRLSPSVAQRLEALEQSGQLTFAAGRIVAARPADNRALVRWQPRGGAEPEVFPAARVINCTGGEGDLAKCAEPLVRRLLERGLVSVDAHGLGFAVDSAWQVLGAQGEPTPRLYAVGPLTRGTAWEIVAVPDIRQQVCNLARILAQADL